MTDRADSIRLLKLNAGNPKPKKIYQIPRKSAKKIAMEKSVAGIVYVKPKQKIMAELPVKAVGDLGMDKFWKMAEVVIAKKPYCWNCNDHISKADYRASTAHIFPKSPNSGFPSVASNEWNFVVAGNRCGCHHKTHRIDTFSQMAIFPVAVQRFFKFHHLITEKRKYLDLFIEYAGATI